jgi:hypothetical protein
VVHKTAASESRSAFLPSSAVPEESAEGHDDDGAEVEGDIVEEVEDEGEEKEEEEINPWSSEEPSRFRALALFPAATHSVTRPEVACHPRAFPFPGLCLLACHCDTTPVRPPSHESVVLSAPALVRGVPALVQVQAAVGVHDTIRMSPRLARHWRLDVARAHSLIHHSGHLISGASRSSIELVLEHVPSSPPATSAMHLGDTSGVDGSEGTLSNPESHTFGLPVAGGAGSLLPRICVHTIDQGQLIGDSESVEELPSLPSNLALQVSASYYSRSTLRAPRSTV